MVNKNWNDALSKDYPLLKDVLQGLMDVIWIENGPYTSYFYKEYSKTKGVQDLPKGNNIVHTNKRVSAEIKMRAKKPIISMELIK